MTSKTRYSHRVRCCNRTCRVRYRIKKHPKEYVKRPVCEICGGSLCSIEKERRVELAQQDRCFCIAIPFPHRKGSLRLCEHHVHANEEPTAEEWQQHQYMCETPRSG